MRILVTGGAGFIGSNIVDALLAHDHEVAILDDLSTGKEKNISPKAKMYRADILDNDAVTRIFDEFQPEVISHQAAKADVRESLEKPQLYAMVNIIGSLNLLENARRVGTKKSDLCRVGWHCIWRTKVRANSGRPYCESP